ncbi:MAG: hypothetical protein FJW20_17725 [Acidimicrobiia bacterium]|nr:hypothetical protein [Acidimicrobiia bacterium]
MLRMLLFFCLLSTTNAQTELPLWPNGAPGSDGKTAPEAVRLTPTGERVVSSVHSPSLTPYLPANPGGAAVIIAPGGGHRELWTDHEGHNAAKWLSSRGIAGASAELHVYSSTGHGFGVRDSNRTPAGAWLSRFHDWLCVLNLAGTCD